MYDGPKQRELLTTEIDCACWASALMCLIYQFTEWENQSCSTNPPFEIPDMWYINVVLAVTNNYKQETYLLEEVIDKEDGDF